MSNCFRQNRLVAREDNPHYASLTAQVGEDIIELINLTLAKIAQTCKTGLAGTRSSLCFCKG
ncbi:MAG: hypothetical protein GX893_04820 [Firmicutes bacterium]|nr:hypothetical protein [Bacillota bacterium]